MEIPRHFNNQQLEALERLRNSDRRHLKSIFTASRPPEMGAFLGEFDAELLDQGGQIAGLITRVLFGTSGNWIGKAFCPIDATRGVGYNCFRKGSEVLVKLPMDTSVIESSFDQGKSLIISYKARNFGLIRWLTGEVRQVVPQVLLGMGMIGPKFGKRDRLRRKIPFVMVGPVRDYQFHNSSAPFELKKAA